MSTVGRGRTWHDLRPRAAAWGWALAAIVIGAAALRWYGIGRQGLWFDEAQTGWMMRAPLGRMLAGIPRTESTPPLYYLAAWGWVHVFGDTRAGLRSFSALAGVLTVPFAFAAARALIGRRVALVAALLVAVNPLLIWYSQEARAYALLVLLSTVALWLFARAWAEPTPARVTAWAVGAGAAMWSHYFAAFVVLPEAVLLFRASGLRWRLRLWAVLAAAAATIPLVGLAVAQQHHASWIGTIPLTWRLEQVGAYFVDGFTPPAGATVVLASAVAVALGGAMAWWRSDRVERRGALVLAGIAAAAIALPLALALTGVDYFVDRNLLAAAVPALIVLASGLAARHGLAVGLSLAAMLTVLSVGLVAALWSDPGAQRPAWPALARELQTLPSPRVVEFNGGTHGWAKALAFELPHTWWLRRRGARVREFDVVRRVPRTGPCGGRTWWGPACNLPAFGAAYPARSLRALGFRQRRDIRVGGFIITRFSAERPARLRPLRRFDVPGPTQAINHPRHLLLTPTREPVIV